ncbi:MAG: acyl carrier protein [Lachnospiraceae bacterium]|nr:acyl carrier protein [Lachnospiraceae bacterium]
MEFEKLQMIISEVLSLEPEEIRPEMSFVDDLGADSLEVFQIIMAIEEEFDIGLEDGVVASIETVEDALQAIAGE